MSQDDILKSIINDIGDRSLQDTVSKLKFISKIGPNQVIHHKTLSLMDVGLFTSACRTISNALLGQDNTKEKTLTFFRETLNNAYKLCKQYLGHTNDLLRDEVVDLLTDNMRKTITGIENTEITYKENTIYVGKLQALTSTILFQIREIESGLKREDTESDEDGECIITK